MVSGAAGAPVVLAAVVFPSPSRAPVSGGGAMVAKEAVWSDARRFRGFGAAGAGAGAGAEIGTIEALSKGPGPGKGGGCCCWFKGCVGVLAATAVLMRLEVGGDLCDRGEYGLVNGPLLNKPVRRPAGLAYRMMQSKTIKHPNLTLRIS